MLEKEDGKLEFDSGGYHFASSVRSAATSGSSGGMVRARRLAQEVSSLATSLPLSFSSSVFVRCDKERLDVMKVSGTFMIPHHKLVHRKEKQSAQFSERKAS